MGDINPSKMPNAGTKGFAEGGLTPAWTRKEGKSESGGLNAAGRASYNKANPGKPGLKAPQPEGGSRRDSFCARSAGQMKMWPKAAKDPNSRLRKARKVWNCK
jgi:hypothetical protein